ncbi:retrovirus-related pol polyprotein from transposon TNT 1-94 [Tanacetum coccineum]|uniref:Retrovirus-related pol polyprotein from transposon TNT 1-94 n=1 Tax=Tanacetum coccineum TaxID=301880 RepID=A0ABQ5C8H9_9ASTR
MLHSGLHYTHINVPQAHMAVKEKYCDPGIFSLWHDRLGHLRSTMMKRIIKNTHGHPLKDQKFPKIDKVPLCTSCSFGKLIARPSPLKVENDLPMFLERIQAQVEIPNKQAGDNIAQESQKRLKRGRPIGSKDKNPRKRKGTEKNSCHDENVLDETQISKPHLRKK